MLPIVMTNTLIKEILKHHDSATGHQPSLVLLHGQMNNITTSRETNRKHKSTNQINPQQSNCLFLSPSRTFHDPFMPIPVSFIKQLLRRSAHRVHSVLCQVSFSSLRLHQLHQLKDPKSATHLSLCLISSSLAVIQFNPIFSCLLIT